MQIIINNPSPSELAALEQVFQGSTGAKVTINAPTKHQPGNFKRTFPRFHTGAHPSKIAWTDPENIFTPGQRAAMEAPGGVTMGPCKIDAIGFKTPLWAQGKTWADVVAIGAKWMLESDSLRQKLAILDKQLDETRDYANQTDCSPTLSSQQPKDAKIRCNVSGLRFLQRMQRDWEEITRELSGSPINFGTTECNLSLADRARLLREHRNTLLGRVSELEKKLLLNTSAAEILKPIRELLKPYWPEGTDMVEGLSTFGIVERMVSAYLPSCWIAKELQEEIRNICDTTKSFRGHKLGALPIVGAVESLRQLFDNYNNEWNKYLMAVDGGIYQNLGPAEAVHLLISKVDAERTRCAHRDEMLQGKDALINNVKLLLERAGMQGQIQDAIQEIIDDRAKFKREHSQACLTIAQLFHAATGIPWGNGPKIGLVEDVTEEHRKTVEALAIMHKMAPSDWSIVESASFLVTHANKLENQLRSKGEFLKRVELRDNCPMTEQERGRLLNSSDHVSLDEGQLLTRGFTLQEAIDWAAHSACYRANKTEDAAGVFGVMFSINP